MREFDENEAPYFGDDLPTDGELDAATDLLRTIAERDAAASSNFPAGGKIDGDPDGEIRKATRKPAKAKGRGKRKDDSSPTPAMLATIILRTDHYAQDGGGRLFVYSGGTYSPNGAEHVRTRVKSILVGLSMADQWSSRLATETAEFIRVGSPEIWHTPPIDVLNLRNGLLDVNTLELAEHSPEHLSPVQLPVEFDPAATCTAIDTFVGQTFPADNAALAYEIVAFAMLPDNSIQKAILATGVGGNGKSRFLALVAAFLGRSNTSGISLHRLESDKFAAARLYGKLANICPDLPSEHLAGTSTFKAITGGDVIVGEHKYLTSFEFSPYCKMLFSANAPPRANDASDGFFDRWLVVPFDRRFRGEGGEIPAAQLDAMLSQPSELSGLLNRALAVLPALRQRGRFSESDSTRTAFNEFHATTDPMAVWLDGATIDDPEAMVLKDSLHSAYCRYTSKKGLASMTKKAFGVKLKQLRPNIDDAQRTVGGKRNQHVYTGIGLRSEQKPDSANGVNGINGVSPIPVHARARGNGGSNEIKGEEENRVDRVDSVTDTWETAADWN